MPTDLNVGAIATGTLEQRLDGVFRRTLPKLGPEARRQLEAILTPEALAFVGGVLVAWVVSHAIGIGQIVDIIILAIGVTALGVAVFTGLDHLYEFATRTYAARSAPDLDIAADHLAKAINILGIQAVLAVLFRGMPRTWRGGRINARPSPNSTTGLRYRPTITKDPKLQAGSGFTSFWGDITVSTRGPASEQALVLLHERIHQFLAPKLYPLRRFRVDNRVSSYFRSSLWRYLEEALAETVAQIGVNGIGSTFIGVRFPVHRGYAYLTRGGGYSAHMTGGGIVVEGAALTGVGVIMGIEFQLWTMPQ